MLGDLEDTYSAIFGEKMCRQFGEIVLEKKNVQRFWRFGENCSAKLWSAIWRKPFGDVVLELVKEYHSARRPYVEIKK